MVTYYNPIYGYSWDAAERIFTVDLDVPNSMKEEDNMVDTTKKFYAVGSLYGNDKLSAYASYDDAVKGASKRVVNASRNNCAPDYKLYVFESVATVEQPTPTAEVTKLA